MLEIARLDRLTHVSFNPIRFSKIIALLHVFWSSTSHLLPEDAREELDLASQRFLLPEIARQDRLTLAHVSFNPIQFSNIIVSLHVFWQFPLLELARWDRLTHVSLNPMWFSKLFPDHLHHIIARRCSAWHYSVSSNRKTRSVNTCRFQSHSIFRSMFSEYFLS